MNTSSASPPTPNLESLRKVIQEYQPNPSRVPFSNLKPFHDSIVALRGKKASYAVIADLLQQNGVKTSRARVAEYGASSWTVGKGANGGDGAASSYLPRRRLCHQPR